MAAPGRIALFAVLIVAIAGPNPSAIAADPTLAAGFHAMYGLDFTSAEKFFADYERQHPADPVGYAAESTGLVFNELNRMKLLEAEFETDNKKFLAQPSAPPNPQVKERILELSRICRQIAEAKLRDDPIDKEALFALALTYGVLGDYTAMVEHHYWAAVGYGRQGDQFARKLLQRDPEFYDAYVWTGVTNYVYGSLPLSVRWIARLLGLNGDKGTGVANLQLAAEKGGYLRPYAKLLLAITYLREKNKPAAAALLAELSSEFPTNRLFAAQAKRAAANGMSTIGPSTTSAVGPTDRTRFDASKR
jgi:hypothetical protein